MDFMERFTFSPSTRARPSSASKRYDYPRVHRNARLQKQLDLLDIASRRAKQESAKVKNEEYLLMHPQVEYAPLAQADGHDERHPVSNLSILRVVRI